MLYVQSWEENKNPPNINWGHIVPDTFFLGNIMSASYKLT